jgi:hypothetical protein
MSLKVFISHCWEDDQQFTDAILEKLSNLQQIEILIDRRNVPPGGEIRDTIDAMINAADLVVANLTKSSLESREVLAELIRSDERGKKIIPLVSMDADTGLIPRFLNDCNQIRYSQNSFDSALNCLATEIIRHVTKMNYWPYYVRFNLREKYSRKLVMLGIVVANLGFFVWYLINRLLQWSIDSEGAQLLNKLLNNFKGLKPAIWGLSSNWSIIVAIILVLTLRFGKLETFPKKWTKTAFLFILFSAFAAAIYFNSGIDDLLKASKWHLRAIEFLSTTAWSILLSTIMISPFFLFNKSFDDVFYHRYLPWTILTTFFLAILFLTFYFVIAPPDDAFRGVVAGVGLRSGMFLGLYFSAIRAPINAERNSAH